ncbi:MAG: DNA-3-methyladenine glycosylase [Ignavibacteriota bacterium]
MNKISVKRFDRSFFEQEVTIVARELLGSYLYRRIGDEIVSGRIVETEAYHQSDPASHSFRGITERNKVMFGEPGFAYVYFTYGMHYCINVVTGFPGRAEAVLFRALEPMDGTKEMYGRRKKAKTNYDLLSGPAKICQAFSVTTAENGVDLLSSEDLFLRAGRIRPDEEVGISTRVGITLGLEKHWRFFIRDNKFVSKGKPS